MIQSNRRRRVRTAIVPLDSPVFSSISSSMTTDKRTSSYRPYDLSIEQEIDEEFNQLQSAEDYAAFDFHNECGDR